jgi:hypothetical protein
MSSMKQERKETLMALQIGLFVPQGWRMDLLGIADPVEAYETMTRVAQEAEALGYHLIWLFDHFHTVPTPTQEVTFECWTSGAALARYPTYMHWANGHLQQLSQPGTAGKDGLDCRCNQPQATHVRDWSRLARTGISGLWLRLS